MRSDRKHCPTSTTPSDPFRHVRPVALRSLDKLGLEYLDLYLIHQPFGDYYGAWRAMEELYREGLVRAIGVSNFYSDRLVDLILNNEITPAVNQIETHVFNQRVADQKLATEHEVQIEAWGPFSEGQNGFFINPILVRVEEHHERAWRGHASLANTAWRGRNIASALRGRESSDLHVTRRRPLASRVGSWGSTRDGRALQSVQRTSDLRRTELSSLT